MNVLTRVWRSSLGKKYLMAISGCVVFLFVIAHMLGNLQIFIGPDAINRYANFLQSTPEIVWTERIVLLVLILVHIISAVQLSLENKAARPVPYSQADLLLATYASRTMLVSGIIVGLFIAYHLLHFTAQTTAINLTGQDFAQFHDAQGRHDVYKMMIVGFRQPLVAAFYIVGMALLCLHLRHGVQAMFQSLGWRKDAYAVLLDRVALTAAILIFLGYISMPVAILLGYGKEYLK